MHIRVAPIAVSGTAANGANLKSVNSAGLQAVDPHRPEFVNTPAGLAMALEFLSVKLQRIPPGSRRLWTQIPGLGSKSPDCDPNSRIVTQIQKLGPKSQDCGLNRRIAIPISGL
jgi:hypothetical protein